VLVLLPPLLWACGRCPARALRRAGAALFVAGAAGLAALAAREALAHGGSFLVQRTLFKAACLVDVPLVQVTLAGAACWAAGRRRGRAGGDPFPTPAQANTSRGAP
jgi:hypothetical protein